jgi:predicted dehydrogenase
MRRIPIEKREPLRVELESFVRAVRDGTPPDVSPEDALAAIEVSEALICSAANGVAVELAPQR